MRVTDEQARTCFQIGSMPMRQQQVTQFALDLATDLLDARAALRDVCEAGDEAIGFSCKHDSNGYITSTDFSKPIAQYSDDGPDAWPAQLHAAIAAARKQMGEK